MFFFLLAGGSVYSQRREDKESTDAVVFDGIETCVKIKRASNGDAMVFDGIEIFVLFFSNVCVAAGRTMAV
jgi:hypothetical protein